MKNETNDGARNWGQDWGTRMAEAPRDNAMTSALKKMERSEPMRPHDQVEEGMREISAGLSDLLAEARAISIFVHHGQGWTPSVQGLSPDACNETGAGDGSQMGLNADLMDFLVERSRIRQGEHPDFAVLGDPVANAEAFVERQGRTAPQISAQWVNALRKSPEAYGVALGISKDVVDAIASRLEQSVRRMDRPQVGDLVRFEPHEPGITASPFSGRVIAALDTSGGDIRYHLRAEVGAGQGNEVRVYGRDGRFREVSIDQSVGFDRDGMIADAVAPASTTETVVENRSAALDSIRAMMARSASRGDTFGDLTSDLRNMDINAIMSAEDIDAFFYMPVPKGVALLNAEECRDDGDMRAIVQISNLRVLVPESDAAAYIRSQEASRQEGVHLELDGEILMFNEAADIARESQDAQSDAGTPEPTRE